MRLVDLQVGADRGIHLDLHPKLTVVVAGAKAQERLATLLARAYVLAGTEVTGTVDGGGYLTPFDPTAVVALALVGDGPVVLGRAVLPPPDPAPREAARRAVVERIEQQRALLGPLTTDRDQIARLREATVSAAAAGTEERDEAAARSADLDRVMESLRGRPAELDAERAGTEATRDIATARLGALVAARDELASALGPGEDASTLRIGDEVDELRSAVELTGSVGGLRAGEQSEILAWVDGVRDGSAPVSAAAAELIDEVRVVEEPWREAAARGIEGDPDVVRIAAERSDLSANHDLLLELSRSGVLGDTAKAEINGAHIAVVQAAKGAEPAAIAEEQRVLSRYGFDSYLEFTIDTSTRSVGQAAEAKLADLTARVEELDGQLTEARTAAAQRIEALAAAREPVLQKVTAFLGERPEGSAVDAIARVPEVPHAVGRLTVTVDEAIESARAEVVALHDHLAELDDEGRAVEARLVELAEQRSTLESRITQLDDVLGRAAHESAVLDDRLAMADERSATIVGAIGAGEAELDRLDSTPGSYGAHDVAGVVDSVVSQFDDRSATPPPVVLVDAFAPLDDEDAIAALSALAMRAERTQLLYLSSSPAVRSWAESLDPEQGRVVVVSQGRWSPRRLGRRVLGRT